MKKRSKPDALAMVHDTLNKSAKTTLTPADLKAAAEFLTRKNKPITLADMVKYLTKIKGLDKRVVKKYLFKQVHPSVDPNGRLVLA